LDDYDIVHAHYGLTAPLAIAQWNRPIVLSLWGRDLFGKYRWITKVSARFFDAVIVRSEEMSSELGVRAHIVERGVEIETFRPMNKKAARDQIGWKQDANHILFPYAPSREKKDYSRANKIVEEVKSRLNTEVHLQTVYNKPHNLMPIYMNAADLLLMTSSPMSEGSPNTVKEAMACNTPVVTTNVGDVKKLLQNVSNSYVCESNPELVEHTAEIIEEGLSSNGRSIVEEKLQWKDTAEHISSIYESVLQSKIGL
jgi:hypothetical protein